MLGRTTKGIDPGKNSLTTKKVLQAAGNMERNEELAVCTHRLMNGKALQAKKHEISILDNRAYQVEHAS